MMITVEGKRQCAECYIRETLEWGVINLPNVASLLKSCTLDTYRRHESNLTIEGSIDLLEIWFHCQSTRATVFVPQSLQTMDRLTLISSLVSSIHLEIATRKQRYEDDEDEFYTAPPIATVH